MNQTVSHNAFALQFESLLSQAIEMGASDIHFEPFANSAKVRARVDGTLLELAEVTENKFRTRLFEQAKKICGFDMGKFGEPQDARFSTLDLGADFRASLMPVLDGEKIVLRIIPRGKTFSLESYGLPVDALERLRLVLSSWQGLVITSGPTGSGKSSLLYAMLSHIDNIKNNIATIEDPVEYTLPNINQTQIDKKRNLDFAAAIRTAMRQDPDVILIGEIRDRETASAALHAAQTGHLVLTTVHANSAFEVMSRLTGLGCETSTLYENLLFVSAQRLLPKVCEACLGKNSECNVCSGRGEKGRALLFEYIPFDDESRKHKSLTLHRPFKETCAKLLKAGVVSHENAASFL